METLYPNVLSFYEDLSINEACEGVSKIFDSMIVAVCISELLNVVCCTVSLETVDGDFETLQQGLKVVEEEQQRDSHNFILFISSIAAHEYNYSS